MSPNAMTKEEARKKAKAALLATKSPWEVKPVSLPPIEDHTEIPDLEVGPATDGGDEGENESVAAEAEGKGKQGGEGKGESESKSQGGQGEGGEGEGSEGGEGGMPEPPPPPDYDELEAQRIIETSEDLAEMMVKLHARFPKYVWCKHFWADKPGKWCGHCAPHANSIEAQAFEPVTGKGFQGYDPSADVQLEPVDTEGEV